MNADQPHVAPELPMHAWRSLHSHYCERIAQSDTLADQLRKVVGYPFANFAKAFRNGLLSAYTMRHNGVDWYIITFHGTRTASLVAACVPFLGMTTDTIVQVEAQRATAYFEQLGGCP